ncbi:hypothetical protein WICPIJ_008506 [Wickerhamomyces pijperi]|uniref:Uncharacterized protein n=1 Tax=Wickerhamomyces pijperi TaxID=599730 RepID=A0A9P8TI94_WICPI|nr:hypothetical protein WICPIJ_008506 [Wickerhamomyces pijperi]
MLSMDEESLDGNPKIPETGYWAKKSGTEFAIPNRNFCVVAILFTMMLSLMISPLAVPVTYASWKVDVAVSEAEEDAVGV